MTQVQQDIVDIFFRLTIAFVCMIVYARKWGSADLLRSGREPLTFWICAALLVFSEIFNWLRFDIAALELNYYGLAAVVAVAVQEEVLFRGLLHKALTERMSRRWAEWMGSLSFAAMHLQQGPYRFALIFLWGLGAEKLRSQGASIAFLIFMHGLSDICYVFFPTGALIRPLFQWLDLSFLLGALLLLSFVKPKPLPLSPKSSEGSRGQEP